MKELKDYLHLYQNCLVQTEEGKIGRLSSVDICESNYSIIMLTVRYSDKEGDWDVFNDNEEITRVKPILRSLLDMTEEEAHEIEEVMWGNIEEAKFGDKGEVFKMFMPPYLQEYRPSFEIYVKAANWFRKNSFDIDELIEADLAIDKTKIAA